MARPVFLINKYIHLSPLRVFHFFTSARLSPTNHHFNCHSKALLESTAPENGFLSFTIKLIQSTIEPSDTHRRRPPISVQRPQGSRYSRCPWPLSHQSQSTHLSHHISSRSFTSHSNVHPILRRISMRLRHLSRTGRMSALLGRAVPRSPQEGFHLTSQVQYLQSASSTLGKPLLNA